MPRVDPFIGVQNALDPLSSDVVMRGATARNPQLHGADVADVLDIYCSHDACLYFIEPYWEQYAPKDEINDQLTADFFRAAAMAVALMLGVNEEPNPLTALLVELLARRAMDLAGVVRHG